MPVLAPKSDFGLGRSRMDSPDHNESQEDRPLDQALARVL